MGKVLKFQMFESTDVEKEIILNDIVPFVLKKYEELGIWGKKKTYKTISYITRLMFEKRGDEWELVIEAPDWSGNDTNVMIQYVLAKAVREKCEKDGIILKNINYAAASTISTSVNKYIIYDVPKNKEVK